MRRPAALALALWAALAGAAAAQRPFLQDLVEEVRAFSARIVVQPDGSVEVTEEFEVTARGVQIRRGIYRDILLRFRDRLGLFPPEFRLIEAERDGAPETARVVAGEGSLRVQLGREEVLLPPGVHRYRLRYRLADQVDLHPDRAELAWNVNGTGWTLPVRRVSAVVVPPPGAAVLRHEVATGRAGERGQDAAVTPEGGGLRVQTTRPLARGENVTLFVSFPREAVTPTLRLGVLELLEGRPLVLGGAGLLLALAWFLVAWRLVGRDPRPGPIVPVYQPSRSPAWMRVLRRRGFDEDCVVAALLSLAVKGCVVISDGPGEGFTLERRTPPPGAPAPSADEAALLASLCDGGRDRLEVPTARSPVVERVVARYRRLFDEAALCRHVRPNLGWWAGGVALLGAWGLGMAALAPEELLFSMAAALGAGFLGMLAARAAGRGVRQLRRGAGRDSVAEAAGMVVAGLGFAAAAAVVLVLAAQAGDWRGLVVAGAAAGLAEAFRRLLPALTREGRVAMDEIEGTLRYLTVAEAERLRFHAGAGATPEAFEALLPYAVALDLDTAWAERFAGVLSAAAAARGEAEYRPAWYRGARFGGARIGLLRGAVSAGLSRAAAPPPTSGGGGGRAGGGGRSSGGGRGGGGGGGW
jgi:uncharacterized membrane protein YgcG